MAEGLGPRVLGLGIKEFDLHEGLKDSKIGEAAAGTHPFEEQIDPKKGSPTESSPPPNQLEPHPAPS